MSNELRAIVAEAFDDALAREDSVYIENVADRIMEDHADIVAEHGDTLARNALRRMLKDIARRESDQTEQLSLFGLPSVISVPNGQGYKYVRADKATASILRAGRETRAANVENALAKLDTYDAALAVVLPIMGADDSMTLAQAVEQIGT